MAKRGTYNGPFFSSFAERLHGTPIKFGILVGTEAEGDRLRDVVFAAPTPPQPGEDGEPAAPAKDVASLLKSKAAVPFADWAEQHAVAVRKLLPGGLETCGCFAVASEAAAKDLAPLLVPLLKGVVEPLVLSIDPSSRKLSFWQHSGGVKPALRPAQVKSDPHKEALLLWCATAVDLVVPRGPAADEGDAAAAAEQLAGDVQEAVGASLEACTIGVSTAGSRAQEGPLRVVDPKSEATVASVLGKDQDELRTCFLRGGTILAAMPNPEERPCLRQRCLIVGTALVVRRSMELRHAVGLLRSSVAASAAHRLQLALEEAEGRPLEGVLQLPWRALGRPEGSELPFWCGDYCMPDESVDAARERLGQLLGMPEDAFEAAPEHLDEQLRLNRDFQGTYSPTAEIGKEAGSAGRPKGAAAVPMAACAAAVAAVLVALAIPLLMRS